MARKIDVPPPRLRPAWLAAAGLLTVAYALVWPQAARARDPDVGAPDSVLGAWTTQDGHGVIWIEQCGDALCGRIVGILRTPGEPIPTDVRGVSQCGLTIITGAKPISDGSWRGQITDPRTGTVYGVELWLGDAGNLRLRGFLAVPLLGQTQTWSHYAGRLNETCDMT
jgi:uncharacterized protein (DUF2147 family)